jgi:PKD repeat protein
VNAPAPSNEPPDADFNWSCDDLTCHFTDSSEDDDGTITSRNWNFGDGSTSNEVNPSHTYATEGDYTVILTVTDNGGLTDDAQDVVDPEAPPPPNQAPTAEFTWQCDELDCEFESQSSDADGQIEDYSWSFGDGDESGSQNPDHSYSEGGTYQVTLTVTDDDDATNSVTHAVSVTAPPPPNQDPTASFTESCADLTCSFNSAASGDPDGTIVSRSWSFGDGGTSTEENPSHTYAAGGSHDVTLTVTDDDGATDQTTHQVTVTAPNSPPSAGFSPPSCTTGQPCQFIDASTDSDGQIVGWSWDFGDDQTSSAEDPANTYALAGSYSVTLTVTDDAGGTDTIFQTVETTD